MEIIFTPDALDDREYWKRSGDKAIMKKISNLLTSIQETPESGIGKPEKLKHGLSGYWSRRINQEHRIVYRVFEDHIDVLSLRGHYEPK